MSKDLLEVARRESDDLKNQIAQLRKACKALLDEFHEVAEIECKTYLPKELENLALQVLADTAPKKELKHYRMKAETGYITSTVSSDPPEKK